MNKCLECVNHHMNKTEHGYERHRCSAHKGTIVFGELQGEPIVMNCGTFEKLREYRRPAWKK